MTVLTQSVASRIPGRRSLDREGHAGATGCSGDYGRRVAGGALSKPNGRSGRLGPTGSGQVLREEGLGPPDRGIPLRGGERVTPSGVDPQLHPLALRLE